MQRDKSWKKADYPNAKPRWMKYRVKDAPLTQVGRVLKSLDWEKLAKIGKDEVGARTTKA